MRVTHCRQPETASQHADSKSRAPGPGASSEPLLLDELVSIGTLWQDQTLVLHVMRRFG